MDYYPLSTDYILKGAFLAFLIRISDNGVLSYFAIASMYHLKLCLFFIGIFGLFHLQDADVQANNATCFIINAN